MTEGTERRKWLVPVVAGLILLVPTVVALSREPVTLDADTPEGTVQVFLQAIADEDYELAHEQLSTDQGEGCDVGDIAAAGPYESFSATLGDVDEFDGGTFVHVSLRIGTDAGLGSSGYSFDPGPYQLEQIDGAWKITQVAWPYFIYECSP